MEAIITAFVLLIYLVFIALAFVGGYFIGKRKRPTEAKISPSEEDKKNEEREKKELENFFNYRGDKQENISV